MQAVLCGYYGFGNAGDEALLATLLQMLPRDLKPIVLSGNPAQTAQAHGVRALDRWNALAVLEALRESQIFILGGGSILQDVTSWRSVLYYSALVGLAGQMGLQTMAWAQGIGPLRRPWVRQLVQRVLRQCHTVSVRDRNSAQLLSEWQIPFQQTVDPVWALRASATSPVPEDLPMPRAAIILRTFSDLTPARLAVLTEALIQFQTATELTLLLVPFQLPQDVALARELQAALPGPTALLEVADPRQLKAIFRSVEWTLAMRFHGVLMAAAEGCPVWGLSYDPKVSQLLKEIDAPGLDVQDLPLTSAPLVQQWLDHYANGQGLSLDRQAWWLDRALLNQQVLETVLARPS